MCRAVAVLLLLLTALTQADQSSPAASDAAAIPTAEKRELLNAICPGHTTDSGCSVCPEEEGRSAETWELRAIVFGHFVSPRSSDALVSG